MQLQENRFGWKPKLLAQVLAETDFLCPNSSKWCIKILNCVVHHRAEMPSFFFLYGPAGLPQVHACALDTQRRAGMREELNLFQTSGERWWYIISGNTRELVSPWGKKFTSPGLGDNIKEQPSNWNKGGLITYHHFANCLVEKTGWNFQVWGSIIHISQQLASVSKLLSTCNPLVTYSLEQEDHRIIESLWLEETIKTV